MKKPCIVCGQITTNRKFCNYLCYGNYQKQFLKKKTCIVCRKKHKNEKYCSFACQKKYTDKFGKRLPKKYIACPTCGKNFHPQNKVIVYCSRDCKARRYKINSNYFDEITQDNAYILGVIFSCGQMLNKTENKILFRHRDKIIIEMVSAAMGMDYPIKNVNKYWEVRPSSKHLIDRLVELGFRKESKFFWFPEISEELKMIFIQGMMDTAVKRIKPDRIYRLVRSKELFLVMKSFGWKGIFRPSGIWVW